MRQKGEKLRKIRSRHPSRMGSDRRRAGVSRGNGGAAVINRQVAAISRSRPPQKNPTPRVAIAVTPSHPPQKTKTGFKLKIYGCRTCGAFIWEQCRCTPSVPGSNQPEISRVAAANSQNFNDRRGGDTIWHSVLVRGRAIKSVTDGSGRNVLPYQRRRADVSRCGVKWCAQCASLE